MSDFNLFLLIICIIWFLCVMCMLYMIFKLDDIVGNIEDRFTYFNEELVILADVLKEYQKRIDQDDIPSIPLPTGKNVSGW